MTYFYGELLEQIFNFYQGPLQLLSADQLLLNDAYTTHLIAYQGEDD